MTKPDTTSFLLHGYANHPEQTLVITIEFWWYLSIVISRCDHREISSRFLDSAKMAAQQYTLHFSRTVSYVQCSHSSFRTASDVSDVCVTIKP